MRLACTLYALIVHSKISANDLKGDPLTTREEPLVLMDYLRHFDTLSERCREDAGGVFIHSPESCAQEVAEYLAWERMLRVSGPVAEEAYFHIRRTAKR